MKILLFCLLAFCVLETAFGVKLVDQLNEVYKNGVKIINDDVVNIILNRFEVLVDGSNAQSCFEIAKTAMKKKIDLTTYKLGRCRTGGLGIRNVEWAKKCIRKEIDMLEEDVPKIVYPLETCMKKKN